MSENKDTDYSFTRKLENFVFCKDCKQCWEKDMFGIKKVLECKVTSFVVTACDGCTFGERRECI